MVIDWTNPTVVAALVSLAGIALAALAGVIGAIAGARIGASAMVREGERQRADAAAARVREFNVRRIEDTRAQLTAIADAFLAIMDKRMAVAQSRLDEVNTPLLANARLVGDRDALAALARAVVEVAAAFPSNWLSRAFAMLAKSPFTADHRSAMQDARSGVLNALERQQIRALRDEPLLELTAEEIATIPELRPADAEVRSVRESASSGRASS